MKPIDYQLSKLQVMAFPLFSVYADRRFRRVLEGSENPCSELALALMHCIPLVNLITGLMDSHGMFNEKSSDDTDASLQGRTAPLSAGDENAVATGSKVDRVASTELHTPPLTPPHAAKTSPSPAAAAVDKSKVLSQTVPADTRANTAGKSAEPIDILAKRKATRDKIAKLKQASLSKNPASVSATTSRLLPDALSVPKPTPSSTVPAPVKDAGDKGDLLVKREERRKKIAELKTAASTLKHAPSSAPAVAKTLQEPPHTISVPPPELSTPQPSPSPTPVPAPVIIAEPPKSDATSTAAPDPVDVPKPSKAASAAAAPKADAKSLECYQRPVGIINKSNNCWANAMLQFIMNIPSIYRTLRDNPAYSHEGYEPVKQFIRDYRLAQHARKPMDQNYSQSVREIVHGLNSRVSTDPRVQEDASEGLLTLLRAMPQGRGISQPMKVITTTLEEIGDEPTEVTQEIIQHESIVQLDLRSKPEGLFNELFRDFFIREIPEGSTITRKPRYMYESAPNEFLLQVNRFTYVEAMEGKKKVYRTVKENRTVDVPEVLTLPTEYVDDGQGAEYECDSIIRHLNKTASSGHYVAYIKNAGKWWCCNDDRVTLASDADIKEAFANAYIYHYKKRKVV